MFSIRLLHDPCNSFAFIWSDKFGDIPDVLPTKQPFWDRPGVLEDKVLVDDPKMAVW